MTGSIYGYTTAYRFILPDYNVQGWHTYEYNNWRAVDTLLNSFVSLLNFKGMWALGTPYLLNDLAGDADDGFLYKCLVGNTSPSSGSFSTYRTANPTHWTTVDQSAFDATSNRLMKRLRKMQQEANAINANAVRAYNLAVVGISEAATNAALALGYSVRAQGYLNSSLFVLNQSRKVERQLLAFSPANSAFYSQVFS